MMTHKTAALVASLALLVGCGITTPSLVNESRVEIHNEPVIGHMNLDDVDDVTLVTMAHEYERYGTGPMELTLTYDPESKSKTAKKAQRSLKSLAASLKRKGVHSIETDVLPVAGEPQTLVVSYEAVRAQAPSNCGEMPGLQNTGTTRYIGDYKFGCGIEAMLAKQVYRPADLQGVGTTGHGDGRRATNVVLRYQVGEGNERIEGLEREQLLSD